MLRLSWKSFLFIFSGFLILIAVAAIALLLFQAKTGQKSSVENSGNFLADENWQKVFARAFEPVDCPKPRDPQSLPDGYYKGPMIDTHIHMRSLPENPGRKLNSFLGESIGVNISVDKWICMMDVEGTSKALVFFPVWEPTINQSIELVKQALKKYPDRFIPFINPPYGGGPSPDDNLPTVDAKELERMLNIEPDLFEGFGEIPLYGEPGVPDDPGYPPDWQVLMEIYPVLDKYNLPVYFHMGTGQKDIIKKVAKANPDIIFIFHGDNLVDCGPPKCDGSLSQVAEILESSPNVYYGLDEFYGDRADIESKQQFLEILSDHKPLFDHDIPAYKEFIEKHADQVLWGTDRGVNQGGWDKDPQIALAINNYIRAFIGKLDPAVQEKFAYKNAEKLFKK